jgi:hypothetical protein
MGGSGFALDMIRRFNSNLKLQKEQSDKYSKVKQAYLKAERKHIDFVRRKNLSKSELSALKQKIREDIIKERRKRLVITLVISPFIFFGVGFIIAKIIAGIFDNQF